MNDWGIRQHIVGLGVLASFLSGCATIGAGEPVVTEVPKATEHRSLPNGSTDALIHQDGTHLTVRASERCDVQEVQRIERTTIRERKNLTPNDDWWAGIGGAVLLGLGAGSVASPSSFQGDDHKYSAADVRTSGYVMLGLGAALMTVPIIDYVRAHGEAEHKVERVEVPGAVIERNVACRPVPPGTALEARLPSGRTFPLGSTDQKGVVEADLDDVLPPTATFARVAQLSVCSDRTELATASLAALYDRREAATWRATESNECGTSLDESGCEAQARYTRDFPDGDHVLEARQAIDAAANRRRSAAEEAAWTNLRLQPCRSPAKNDIATIEAACAPIEQFLTTYPDGQHVDAAREALKPAQLQIARLEEAEERRNRVDAPSTGMFIPYAGNGGGPTLCADGMLSHSSGRGTCSHHGGVAGGSSHHSGGGHRSGGGSHGGHHSSGGHGRRK